MARFPKKEDGAKFAFDFEGVVYNLTCKLTGKSFNGIPSLAWYHDNGEQANRSINGKITFIIPSETASEQTTVVPHASIRVVEQYDEAENLEQYVYERAWNIAHRRHPTMDTKMDVFGMIVNSIVVRLISLKV